MGKRRDWRSKHGPTTFRLFKMQSYNYDSCPTSKRQYKALKGRSKNLALPCPRVKNVRTSGVHGYTNTGFTGCSVSPDLKNCLVHLINDEDTKSGNVFAPQTQSSSHSVRLKSTEISVEDSQLVFRYNHSNDGT